MHSVSLIPSFETCAAALAEGRHQVVYARLVVDLETPVSAMLKLMDDGQPSFLLESVEGGEVRGRYSIIGLAPDMIWRCFGAKAEISHSGQLQDKNFTVLKEKSLDSLRCLLQQHRIELPPELPPMASGLIGYLGYDMVKQMERLPEKDPDTIGIPDACLMRPTVMAIFDSVAGVVFLVSPVWAGEAVDSEKAYKIASARIMRVVEKLRLPLASENRAQEATALALSFSSNCTREGYAAMVNKAKEYIAAGDIFQVVPSQRFSTSFKLPAFSLYRAIRHLNPSPFLFFLNFGAFTLVGASPEILVRLRNDKVVIRPIAGTRKRGKNYEEDQALQHELLHDPKELAEHLMLLDLGRNDIGRVAVPGSIRITEKMVVEKYSHVMHIVSNVEGKLTPGLDAVDALVAGFPAGTVSGAPKIRAMEIIDELEPHARSFYGGAVGYFSSNGSMDTCIALRTGLIKDGMLHIQAGGGVVADSDPDAEYEETVNKAKALMRAAEEAVRFL